MGRVDFHPEKIVKAMLQDITNGVDRAAKLYLDAVDYELSRRSSNKGNGGIPSPVGSPPALKTGTLRRSVQHVPARVVKKEVRAKVGSNLVYAPVHEFSKKFPRPYFRPALNKTRRRMVSAINASLSKALSRATLVK